MKILQLVCLPFSFYPKLNTLDVFISLVNKHMFSFSGSTVSAKVEEVLISRFMLRDVPQLSTGPQTAAIEGFHSVVNHYAPKMIGFSYGGMVYRYRTLLDWNIILLCVRPKKRQFVYGYLTQPTFFMTNKLRIILEIIKQNWMSKKSTNRGKQS